MKIANSITELIGHTPMLRLKNYATKMNLKGEIIAKLEYFNPAGSVKDRVALSMIDAANLVAGDVIIEPTSGNTGIGLAMVAASRGIRLILTMPKNMSLERRKMLAALGAEVVLTPAEEGMLGSIKRAKELQKSINGAVILGQFENPANPIAHAKTTALEIIEDTKGEFDAFVACVGTGGTISGVGRLLKKYYSYVNIVAVEPNESPMISEGRWGEHKIQGIGANFIPKNYDALVVDNVMRVSGEEAYETCRILAKSEGFLVGISSGAALAAATKIATTKNNRLVVLLPDTGERYISTGMFG
ncbi:MAG: cysteine synthase A [Bacteroidales bacterium]